ncbi:DNA circularization protein [Intestinirhabdus alba]|jgi:prophage DNA circulation protein|uniref:Multidrug DMT transporter permease n=1 Tax=Intestinirhabdus alba TaxID=2899544 RepID=A0A6L6IR29_9ENTR|nr:DNA circularization N-terminal domain-containing protein [Intestinirhabdus alba]MTH47470.1 multidrug DMT transporter permease [Intestinirhabdus alba]
MGWENMQPASFRGVTFDVIATDEEISRDHAAYEYPHVDGADLKDLGRKSRPFRLTALLWGDTYEYHLQKLIAALDEPGDGELIHPVYGSIPSVIVTGYGIHHDAENPDSCTVDLSFLENRTGTALFSAALPEMFGASLFDTLDSLTAELGEFFDAVTAPLNTANSLIKRAKTVESTLINTLLTYDSDISFTMDQMVGLAENPAQFVQALSEVLETHVANMASAVPALASTAPVTAIGLADTVADVATSSTVISTWNEVVKDMDTLVSLPEAFINGDTAPTVDLPSDASPEDVQDIKTTYAVAAVTELASAATAILSDDEQTAQLTPNDIGKLVSDVRIRIQTTIDLFRHRYEPTRETVTETAAPVGIMWLTLVDSMKTIALTLQDLGVMILARRPPLTRRQVQADSCLHLLAHLWYGDHHRSAELLHLNPEIRNPNQITAGMVLNAYAR